MVLDFQATDKVINHTMKKFARRYTSYNRAIHGGIPENELLNRLLWEAYKTHSKGVTITGSTMNTLLHRTIIDAIRLQHGRSVNKVKGKVYDFRRKPMLSLNMPLLDNKDDKPYTLRDTLRNLETPPDILAQESECTTLLGQAMECLTLKEQHCLRTYLQGVTMKTIGRQMGVTESRICKMFAGYRKPSGEYMPGIYDKLRQWFEARNITLQDLL